MFGDPLGGVERPLSEDVSGEGNMLNAHHLMRASDYQVMYTGDPASPHRENFKLLRFSETYAFSPMDNSRIPSGLGNEFAKLGSRSAWCVFFAFVVDFGYAEVIVRR